MPSKRRSAVGTGKAPAAIGPYSQAIRAGDYVFLSGQIALDPETGEFVADGIEAETRRVMTNLSNVLQAAGSSLALVVKTTVFLASLEEFVQMNEVYAAFFPEEPPARSTVEVAALPRGARVEIDVIALLGPTRGD